MLSEIFYKGCSILVPIFNSLGIFSLEWDAQRKLFVKPHKINRIFILNVFIFCCIFIFLIFQLFRSYGKSYNDFVFVFVCTMANFNIIQTNVVTNVNIEECLMTTNSVLLFLRQIHGKVERNLFR